MVMQTKITSKFQTTIPKKVREKLKLSVHDSLEWHVERGKITVLPLHKNFLLRKNSVKIGSGDIDKDISLARERRAERYK